MNVKMIDILHDNLGIYKGVLSENYVATQLVSNDIPIYYWKSKDEAEVDFLIETINDGVIPIEVKVNDNTSSKSLNVYMQRYKPEYGIRISTKNFGYKNNIKSVPLYATFLIH